MMKVNVLLETSSQMHYLSACLRLSFRWLWVIGNTVWRPVHFLRACSFPPVVPRPTLARPHLVVNKSCNFYARLSTLKTPRANYVHYADGPSVYRMSRVPVFAIQK